MKLRLFCTSNLQVIRDYLRNYKFIFWLIFLWHYMIFGQNYSIQKLEVANNGGSDLVKKILMKDATGFLWYSTYNGVVKEMGGNRVTYPYNNQTLSPIYYPDFLFETSNGLIAGSYHEWFFLLNPISGVYSWYSSPSWNDSKFEYFCSINEDDKGNLWITTNNGFLYQFTQGKKFVKYNISQMEPDQFLHPLLIMDILEDESIIFVQNEIWYRFLHGKVEILLEFKEMAEPNNIYPKSIISTNGTYFEKNTSGNYWFDEKPYKYHYISKIDRHIFQFPLDDIKLIPLNKSNNKEKKTKLIAKDRSKLKVFEFDNSTNNINLHVKDEIELNKIITNYIVDEGNFWAHTQEGITRINFTEKSFKVHLKNEEGLEFVEPISCRGLSKDKEGNIYLYTQSGWFEMVNGSNSFKKITFLHEKTNASIDDGVYNFYRQNDSISWGFGYTSGLFKLNMKNKTFQKHIITNDDDNFEVVYDVQPITKEVLLIAGNFGLIEFNMRTEKFREANQLNDFTSIKGKSIFDIYFEPSKNQLWLGMIDDHGMYKKDLDTGEVTHFYKGNKAAPLIDNNVTVLIPDYKGSIWIGTQKGLQKLNIETLETESYTVENGLKNDNITGVLLSGDYIFASTFNGLSRIHQRTGKIDLFFEENGLSNDEFNKKSFFKYDENSFFFGGIDGLVQFNPKDLKSQEYKNNRLFLIEANFYDKEIDSSVTTPFNLENITKFSIPYNNNNLGLKFTINDILNPEKNTYKYRIEKLGKNWINLGNFNTLMLQGIAPGNYILEVQGYNTTGNPTNTLTYQLQVEQIFYKKSWFVILNASILFGIILLWHFYRRDSIRFKFNQKNKLTQLEAQALRAQMNPHFIFNALNVIQSVMILKGEEEANVYLSSFSKLLRLTMDMSNSEYISIKDEELYLNMYLKLEALRLNNNLEWDIEVSNDIDVEKTRIPCFLFQPLIENAIMHGLIPKKTDRKLSVTITLKDSVLIGKIVDNGIGRTAASMRNKEFPKKHKSWATQIMKERVDISNSLYDKKIVFKNMDLMENRRPTGTITILEIPILENKILS